MHCSEHPAITNTNGFEATLTQEQGLVFSIIFLQIFQSTLMSSMPSDKELHRGGTPHSVRATVSPMTLAQSGPECVTHNHNFGFTTAVDIW